MQKITANMAGTIWKVLVSAGHQVEEGQELVILESMKMEIPFEAEKAGKVVEIKVKEGDFVNEGDLLIRIE